MVRTRLFVSMFGIFVLVLASVAQAQDRKKGGGAGQLESATGTLLTRESAEKGWKAVPSGAAAPERDLLLALPAIHATIKSANGAVRLTLAGNVPQQSLTPALESAVSLRKSADFDLDLVLDRGRILLSNLKQKGAALVRVYTNKEAWEISLKEPGTEVALEMNSRWAPGVPHRAQYKDGAEPTAEAVLLVLKGAADVKLEGESHTMSAPPGPTMFHWDSVLGAARRAQPLPELPPWAKPGANKEPRAAAVAAAVKPLIASVAEKAPNAALKDLLTAADKESDKQKASLLRQLAVTGFGAVDDLANLIDASGNEKHPDERLVAIEALRHWIGRKAGQDGLLSRFLVRERGYSPEHATIVLQLLHSYGQKSIEDPLTYELLIAYLQHDKLPIRELAAWHLYRLAPAGRKIPYDPAGPAEKREATVKAWKQLIPKDQLPPPPTEK
jgi:hypothetical protein